MAAVRNAASAALGSEFASLSKSGSEAFKAAFFAAASFLRSLLVGMSRGCCHTRSFHRNTKTKKPARFLSRLINSGGFLPRRCSPVTLTELLANYRNGNETQSRRFEHADRGGL
jgi:hypothetical protein